MVSLEFDLVGIPIMRGGLTIYSHGNIIVYNEQRGIIYGSTSGSNFRKYGSTCTVACKGRATESEKSWSRLDHRRRFSNGSEDKAGNNSINDAQQAGTETDNRSYT